MRTEAPSFYNKPYWQPAEPRQCEIEAEEQVFVISIPMMEQIIDSKVSRETCLVNEDWERLRNKTKQFLGYVPTMSDAVAITRLIKELGFVGAFKAYVKRYGGKTHIILKGSPGLRNFLTGTRYLAANIKMVSVGLGTYSTKSLIKGALIGIVLMTAYRVLDHFMRDEATLAELFGGLASDIVKIGIAGLGGWLAALAIGFVTPFAAGPLLAVVVVTVGIGIALDVIDNKYGLTQSLIERLSQGSYAQAYPVSNSGPALSGAGSTLQPFTGFSFP